MVDGCSVCVAGMLPPRVDFMYSCTHTPPHPTHTHTRAGWPGFFCVLLSHRRGLISQAERDRIFAAMRAIGLPTMVPRCSVEMLHKVGPYVLAIFMCSLYICICIYTCVCLYIHAGGLGLYIHAGGLA